MSFKLLAIRPLEGTDPSLLKGLKPNCIYRFYNEYDYLYEEEQEDVSYIDYQDKYLSDTNNEKNNYLKLEHKPTKAIKYNKQLPNDFFGENINVSAIVGENGSGKSSLLELFYAFLYNHSVLTRILSFKQEQQKSKYSKQNGKVSIRGVRTLTTSDALLNIDKLIQCNVELYLAS
ncbi:hypothetical protein [Myroides marinus]|uniref:hypothetical protein n=1 Tax=Myroides marinus TaxID=703342 RepID=UPI0025750ABB|nr:hypothetical protein [Myroides marinus]MDM1369250.1 hypothetical protein [Myroides marinus]MDM1370722.1 hypothetical protein [Myroides marinus]MDM1531790.1 hypothetical protein [Myroides marinus]MDM1538786.1 hypothetical protein [Myroides marinus]